MKESQVHLHHPEERAELFEARDGTSTEKETQELLYALVRSYKPEVVLETGTGEGYGSIALATACRDNGFGHVITVEHVEEPRRRAGALLESSGLIKWVDIVAANSPDFLRAYDGPPFGFVFLDTYLPARIEELKILRERKLALGPVLIHDTSRRRSEVGMNDCPSFPNELDTIGLPYVENPLSRGWRLYDLRPRS